MFEKEADLHASIMAWDEDVDTWETIAERSFQQGAEFGYNKANEWHYVKDGDYPKDDNDVLVLLKDETMQVDYYFPKIGWNLSCKADVIAWKEIVLPELKESE